MAFKVRLEYWKLSKNSDGVNTVILDKTIAPADEHEAAVEGAALPTAPLNESYAMSAFGVTGACVIAVGPDVDADPTLTGKLVQEGGLHWFKVDTNDKVSVIEYV
ncbi:hypothetical protein [Mesorhizobium sp. M8A.F.Ca.ET.021.01.1.1]|uniref:hypothetical protein n=1 Tax=Mesorhizobium sp. M8A.F.Ca.ET.021.01.1.1 TaxID=2496757 RepID=UPI000FC99DD0|nr:hypothetical protein [Mesorhizobium sp. M8A.F.Ca.ET.021.01.1.1]RUW56365.1 hypothetical protein EOA36_04460 [Mesorhizobium sp. M8A.F.Ca.ET.021.01.1.1]